MQPFCYICQQYTTKGKICSSMSWKDWLYIPKSDKIAIMVLLSVVFILLGVSFFLSFYSTKSEEISADIIPADYKAWQQQLYKESDGGEEPTQPEKRYRQPYFQPKLNTGETIELNSADTSQLKTIPGIGSMFARRIVNYRESLGGYADIGQLNEVWGLDTYLFESIMPYLTLDPRHDSLRINTDSFAKLLGHPYLDYKQVQAITDLRERKGPIRSIKRLALLEEFKQKDIERLSMYASFR